MRILIADDNQLIRHGVKQLLSTESNWDVCGEARDGTETLEMAQKLLPDVLLMDVRMPGGLGGLDVSRQLRKRNLRMKIIIMSQHDPAHLLPSALEAGADGCLDKANLGTDLISSIRKIVGTS